MRPVAEHAWSLGVDVGQKVFERSSNLFRVGPLEADLDLIGSHRLDSSRQVQERSKDAEGILGLIVGLIETTDEKFLGVAPVGNRQELFHTRTSTSTESATTSHRLSLLL